MDDSRSKSPSGVCVVTGLLWALLCWGCGESEQRSGAIAAPTPLPASSLSVRGTAPVVGTSSQFVAVHSDASGVKDVSNEATWISSNNFATVASGGLVSGVAEGEAEIIVTYQGVVARQRIAIVLCGTAPGSRNQVLPVFSSPFQGRYRLISYFDHESPIGFLDNNGYQLNACGVADRLKTDGHAGVDYVLPGGTPVFAVADGIVLFAGTESPRQCPPLGGRVVSNTLVELQHFVAGGEVLESIYYHLGKIDVTVNQSVSRGQQLGLSGGVGCIVGEALHFGVRRVGRTNGGAKADIDPYGWEAPGPDPWATNPRGATSVWLWRDGEAPLIQQR